MNHHSTKPHKKKVNNCSFWHFPKDSLASRSESFLTPSTFISNSTRWKSHGQEPAVFGQARLNFKSRNLSEHNQILIKEEVELHFSEFTKDALETYWDMSLSNWQESRLYDILISDLCMWGNYVENDCANVFLVLMGSTFIFYSQPIKSLWP